MLLLGYLIGHVVLPVQKVELTTGTILELLKIGSFFLGYTRNTFSWEKYTASCRGVRAPQHLFKVRNSTILWPVFYVVSRTFSAC